MEKIFIKNRDNKKISVIVEKPENPIGLAFVMHGLGGFKEQPHIVTFAQSFLDNNYIVVRFDTTNTFGESDGDYADATVTNYYADLEDVINWAKKQKWYQEPFCLAGHSLGGICTALYAEKYSNKIKALAPISTVVSGKLNLEDIPQEKLDEWNKSGWRETVGYSSGLIKKLKWFPYLEDILKYDLLPEVNNLTMPVLMIVGTEDTSTPPEHQRVLFNKLPEPKELQVIKGAPHTFREEVHLQEIKETFDKWIKSIK